MLLGPFYISLFVFFALAENGSENIATLIIPVFALMQDNHPNRVFSFVLSFLLFKPLLFFLLFFFYSFPIPPRLVIILRSIRRFFTPLPYFSDVFLPLYLASFRPFSSRGSFFRETTRPFNRIAFSRSRYPSIPSLFRRNSALLQFLRLSYSSRFFLPSYIRHSPPSHRLALSTHLASYTP